MPWNSPVRNRLRILVSWRAKKSRRRIDENKRQIVANGVPGDDPGVLGLKQIPKMLQPRPVPLDDALKQALGEIDVLEGYRQPKQGEDVVDEKVQKPWGHHQIQRPQPSPAGPPSLCGCHGSRSLSAADCRGPVRSGPPRRRHFDASQLSSWACFSATMASMPASFSCRMNSGR